MTLYFKKTCYVLSILFISSSVFAKSSDEQIKCVSLPIIQQSSTKIDTAQKVQNVYLVYSATSPFQTNKLWWYVGVGQVASDSAENAIIKAQNIVHNARIQENIYAIKQGNEYICKYGPGQIEARGKDLS